MKISKFTNNNTALRAVSFMATGILLGLGILTITLSGIVRNALQERAKEKYISQTQQINNWFMARFDGYINLLYSGRAIIDGSHVVTNSEWNTYFNDLDALDQYKGFTGVSFKSVVRQGQLDSFIAARRTDPTFGVNYKVTPAGVRSRYALTTLLYSRQQSLIPGEDFLAASPRKETYLKAESTQQAVMSPPTTLLNGSQGVFIVLPVYDNHGTKGFVHLTINFSDFFSDVFSADQLDTTGVRVTDVTSSKKASVLYTSPKWAINNADQKPTTSNNIDFAGRKWQIDYILAKNYADSAMVNLLPALILVVGLFLIIFMCVGLYMLRRITMRYTATKE